MCPIDAIRPPSKKKKLPQAEKKSVIPENNQHRIKKPAAINVAKRHTVMWLLVSIIILIVIISWAILFQGGHLTKNNGNGYLSVMGNKISQVWDTFKTDILKIKESVDNINLNENINAEEQRIKDLEDRVFPQFNDPTRQ